MNCKCPNCEHELEYQPSEPEIGIDKPIWFCNECNIHLDERELNYD